MTQFTQKVLDHGFVTLRNLAGPTRRIAKDNKKFLQNDRIDGADELRAFDADDTDVANSARMSFGGTDGERTYEMEMKLNRYLLANKHMTPFESIEVWLEMKLPIFVARQFVRHRTAALNEISGRYVTLPAEWYIPEVVGGKAKDKKQGQEDNLSGMAQTIFRTQLDEHCKAGYKLYTEAIEAGVAAEHARLHLSLNHYTHWLMKMNLRNLFHFLSLRKHSHAQVEARAYAFAIIELLEPQIPGLMQLFNEQDAL